MNERPDASRRKSRSKRPRRRGSPEHIFLSMLPELPAHDDAGAIVRKPAHRKRSRPELAAADNGSAATRRDSSTAGAVSHRPSPTPTAGAGEQAPAAGGTPFPDPLQISADALKYAGAALQALNACIVQEGAREIAGPLIATVTDQVRVFRNIAEHWAADPSRLAEAQSSLMTGFLDLWSEKLRAPDGEDGGS